MQFIPFELERWQSTWENRVRFNLSESGVHPLTIQEQLGLAGASAMPLLGVRLGYSQSNGTDLLRERVAALYPGASPDQILVTTGSSEANFVTCWRLIEPGDKVAVMMPNYLHTWGLAQNFAHVRPFHLHEKEGWEPYPEEVRTAIATGTRLVVVTNPHNPTGHVLSPALRAVILERTREVGAWLLADEVYTGAERDGTTTPSFWGTYERVIVVNGLSKAYGLPGLRIGWIVAPRELTEESWKRHDYTMIGPSGATDHLAAVALESRVRDKLIERTRRILHANYPVMEAWLKSFGDTFTWHPPRAGAICWARYRQTMEPRARGLEVDIGSARLVGVADQEVHELDDRRLVGEVARVGETLIACIPRRTYLGVELAHQLDNRLGGGERSSNPVQQFIARHRQALNLSIERHLEVIQDFRGGLSRDGHEEFALDYLDRQDAVELEVARFEGLREWKLGVQRERHATTPRTQRARRNTNCRVESGAS